MIRLDSVSKRYGARTVIHDLSFGVESGEILGFLGPNGAGKTTTIRMIAGAITATTGTVTVAGHDMATKRFEAARCIGYLPERPPLYDTLDVSTYIDFVARAKGIPRAERARERERVIDACRLADVARREIYKLSKGYRQRVGLAQALLGNPPALLLDEPTIGLDPGQMHETREVIRAAGDGHAVLLSTHILPEVTLICARVAIIDHGRLLAVDTPAGLERAMEQSNAVVARVRGAPAEIEDAVASLETVTAVRITPQPDEAGVLEVACAVEDRGDVEAAIARALAGRFDLLALERRRPTLENVFLHYVARAKDEEQAA